MSISRILTIFLFSVTLLCLLGYLGLYGISEYRLTQVVPNADFTFELDGDLATLAKGKHIARTRGCFGCHGQQLQGKVFTEQWDWVDVAVAPNLALLAKHLDSATLERAIRQGIGQDGRALWSMPSYNWVNLTDEDVAALIAYLRSAPVVDNPLPSPSLGLAARWRIATGAEQHMAQWSKKVPALQDITDPSLKRGHYLAMTTCSECHGLDLRGNVQGNFVTPDLAIIASYSETAFANLMRHGQSQDGRADLGLMTMIAKDRFAYFSDEERTDLYRYLQSLVNQPVPENVAWRQ